MASRLDLLFPGGMAGIIFDCDGVMIDSEDANRFFYNKVLAWLGLPPMNAEQERFAFMATARQALAAMTPPADHPRIEEAIREGVDYNRDIMPRTRLMPGFREFVELAHGLGLKMAIDTNRVEAGIKRILDFFALPNYFDPVISASSAAPKPSGDGARLVAASWGVPPGAILFIGDSATDGGAARDAGAVFGAFGPGAPKGDARVADFASFGEELSLFAKKPHAIMGGGIKSRAS